MSKYIAFDVETGGLDPKKHSLLTLYAEILDNDFRTLSKISFIIKPDDGVYKVTDGALAINKINLVEHAKDAVDASIVGAEFNKFLQVHSRMGKDRLVPIGHNVNFDIGFITSQLIKQETYENAVSHRALDTASIAQYLKLQGKLPPTSSSLTSIANYFKLNVDGAHNAEFDVKLTIAVLKRFLEV